MPAITPEEVYENQRTQIGIETTAGTDVATTVLLEAMTVEMGVQLDLQPYSAMGRKFPRLVAIGNEDTGLTYAGKPTYDEQIYVMSAMFGNNAAVTQGTLGKRWSWPIVLTGTQSPQTLSIQQGDSLRARKVNFGVFSDYTLKVSNTTNDISGSGFSHAVQDNQTLTASPVVKAFQVIGKPQWALFMDTTSNGIGQTFQQTPLDIEFGYTTAYSPLYAINRSGAFKNSVDGDPVAYVKVLYEADAQGMAPLAAARLGSLQYIRLEAVGAQIENTFLLDLGAATGGTFTLTYGANTTAALAWNADGPTTIQTALTGLASVGGGNATVSGAASPHVVTFIGTLATVNTLPVWSTAGVITSGFSANGALLTGPSPLKFNPLTPTAYLWRLDASAICTAIGKYTNKDKVLAIEYTFTFIEDPAWLLVAGGTVAQVTMVNTLAAL